MRANTETARAAKLSFVSSSATTLDERLEAVRLGAMTWDRFFFESRADWHRLAAYVLRRWRMPAAVQVEDLVQELMLGAFEVARLWEPGRADFGRFVRWNAMVRAKKWAHRQRNALRRDDKSPGRFPVTFSTLESVPEEASEPTQERDFERIERIGHALASVEIAEPRCILTLIEAGGSLDKAAQTVYEDQSLRQAVGVRTKSGARRVVGRVARFLEQQDGGESWQAQSA